MRLESVGEVLQAPIVSEFIYSQHLLYEVSVEWLGSSTKDQ